MTITSSLRFLYIFWGSGLLCDATIAGVSPICPRSLEAYLNGSSWIAPVNCTAQEQATTAAPARRRR